MAVLLDTLGIWNWAVLGLILLVLELLAPGIFLFWIGLAALATSVICAVTGYTALADWQIQTVMFLVLSVLFVLIGRKYFNPHTQVSDQPMLNRRADQLIGLRTTLQEPIINGQGRARFDDTLWRVSGPDLPAGTTVIVREYNDGELRVEPLN